MTQNVFVPYPRLRKDYDIPYCRLHINRLIDRGIFPQAVWLGPNRKVWRTSDIEDYLANRPETRPTGLKVINDGDGPKAA